MLLPQYLPIITSALLIFHFAGTASKKQKQKVTQGRRLEYRLSEEITFDNVKHEFGAEFGGFAEPMLCAACKFTATCLKDEIAQRTDVNSSRRDGATQGNAFDAACENIPDPLIGVPGPNGPEFRAYEDVAKEDKDMADKAKGNAGVARTMAHRLCVALMAEFRVLLVAEIEMLAELEQPPLRNWERLLCARNARLCKLSQLEDEDETDEADGTDSVDKKRDANKRRQEVQFEEDVNKFAAAAVGGDRTTAMAMMKDFEKRGIKVPDNIIALLGVEDGAGGTGKKKQPKKQSKDNGEL